MDVDDIVSVDIRLAGPPVTGRWNVFERAMQAQLRMDCEALERDALAACVLLAATDGEHGVTHPRRPWIVHFKTPQSIGWESGVDLR